MSEVPRVMRVEYCQRDRIMGGAWRDWTEADVMTPIGEVHVTLPGYHAEKPQYPTLMDRAMDHAWMEFCEAPIPLSHELAYLYDVLENP